MVTGVRPHRYPMKTFDDDSDQSSGVETQARRGPKIIKFKQKKPSERLALSQLKSERERRQPGRHRGPVHAPKYLETHK